MAHFHDDHCFASTLLDNPRWRRVLWIALVISAGFFLGLGTGTGWPVVIVAAIMVDLGLQGAFSILKQARAGLCSHVPSATPLQLMPVVPLQKEGAATVTALFMEP